MLYQQHDNQAAPPQHRCSLFRFSLPHFLRCHPRMPLEIPAKETDISKMVFPSYFLDTLRTAFQLHLQL